MCAVAANTIGDVIAMIDAAANSVEDVPAYDLARRAVEIALKHMENARCRANGEIDDIICQELHVYDANRMNDDFDEYGCVESIKHGVRTALTRAWSAA
jgi:hypothetical protein